MRRLRDLALGIELARTGGWPALARLGLTTLGVAIGVVMLLAAASVPTVQGRREARTDALGFTVAGDAQPGRALRMTQTGFGTLVGAYVDLQDVRAEGPAAPRPPGVARLPGPGEVVVSPALARLARTDSSVRVRLGARVVGEIGHAGLIDPDDLRGYRGATPASPTQDTTRILAFGRGAESLGVSPFIVVLTIVGMAGLLAPIAAFVAAAVRFGGAARDRRLAAVRLAGADRAQARWIAAGESLVGAVGGLLLGGGLFVLLRPLAGRISVDDIGVFAQDVVPRADLLALIVLGVPVAAVGLTLVALRAATADPLGAARRVRPVCRRLAWRLAFPLAGVSCLEPYWSGGQTNGVSEGRIGAGVLCMLFAAAAATPWLLERVVARASAGPLAWELARRRLLADPGAASRTVAGVVVAVAAAVALQSLFASSRAREGDPGDPLVSLAERDVQVTLDRARELSGVRGVREAEPLVQGAVQPRRGGGPRPLFVAPCSALADFPACRDGEVYASPGLLKRLDGRRSALAVDPQGPGGATAPLRWSAAARPGPESVSSRQGLGASGVLLITPGALRSRLLPGGSGQILLRVDADDRAGTLQRVRARLRETAPRAEIDAGVGVRGSHQQIRNLHRVLTVGALLILVAMGAGLFVATLEALRERRRPLAVLAAVGVPARTLRLSILWQTAVPVAVGLVCAVAGGLALAAMLLLRRGGGLPVEWAQIGLLSGSAAIIVLGVTALTLPIATQLSGPEHLRTE